MDDDMDDDLGEALAKSMAERDEMSQVFFYFFTNEK